MAFRPVAPAVQAALKSGLAAETTVPCSIGYPVGGVASKQVWFTGEWQERVVRAVSGWGGRDVVGEIEARVMVTETSEVWTAVEADALTIAAAIEDLIVADPTLSGAVANCWVTLTKSVEAHPEERTIQCGLSLTIAYEATVSAATT